MLNVLFYHAFDIYGIRHPSCRDIYLSTVVLYLKTYIDTNFPELTNKINWLTPEQQKLTDQELINYCSDNQVDLLCTSHNIWSSSYLYQQLSRVHNQLPKNTVVVAGGPSIDVNVDPNFFKTYPYIDYAIYGSGEVAFADLINSILTDKKLIVFNTSNIAWFDYEKNKQVTADFKYVPISPISPYCSNRTLLQKMVKEQQLKNINVIMPYMLTRGCPYSCTFCDWNLGLSTKVSRRKNSYKEEIDLFHELGIKDIFLADANTGQYQEDIDMVEYLAKKNIEENAGFIVDGNYSKLQKENNLKIFHLLAKGNLIDPNWGFTISIQDIDQNVLQNIDRPDIGWNEHIQIINEVINTCKGSYPKVQLILGLPGQTPTTWRKTLSEVSKYPVHLIIFMSELLPASPAARDTEYQKKFKFVYSKSKRYVGRDNKFYEGMFPQSCVSFTQKEFVDMVLLATIYTSLRIMKNSTSHSDLIDIEYIVDKFLISNEYKLLHDNLYTNWVEHDKFYYTRNFGSKEETIISACDTASAAGAWMPNLSFVKFLMNHMSIKNADFVKEQIKWIYKQKDRNYDTIN
jgi:tRNA A37 methylthiotransferase MiaB